LDEIARRKNASEASFTLPPHCDDSVTDSLTSAGYVEEMSQLTHILNVEDGYEAVWKIYDKGTKEAVRQARRSGVTIRETEGEAELTYFYKLYLAQMKWFGSTPKPYSLFRYLQTSPIASFIVAEVEHQIIGAMLFLHFNSHVRLWCQASDREFLKCRPNNAIFDYVIQWSCKNSCRLVDFGASPPGNKGLVSFKEDWGAKGAWFSTFTRLHSAWRKKLWTVSEPSLRRVYAAIQRLKIRNV
jgi:lipid II:glycine glycyltransferase (peptidoglycan interpeptide bridge formation enzyme)